MAVQNVNWPYIEEAVSFQTGPTSGPYPPYWLSIKERSEGSWGSQRGKQYANDQYQTAQAGGTYQNADGAFDPSNTSSVYYPMVVPFRGYRRRAQCPATINLLTAAQATAGSALQDDGTTVAVGGLPYNVAAGGIYAVAITSAFVYSTTLPGSPVNGTVLTQVTGWAVPSPNATGAVDQVTVQATVTATTSTSLKLAIVWVDVNGNTLSTTTGTAASVTTSHTLTVTGTPPSNCAGATAELVLNSSPGSSGTVTSDNWQMERNSTASAWVQPSKWYSKFTGLTNAWPQDWAQGGTEGTTAMTQCDIFAWLSQTNLFSPVYEQIMLLGPNFLYTLDEPSGSTAFQDMTGNRQPIPAVYLGGATAANLKPGSQLANPTQVYGTGGPVATFVPALPIVAPINLTVGDPTGPSLSNAFTRIFAFRNTVSPASSGGGTFWVTTASINPASNVGYSADTSTGLLIFLSATAAGNHSVSSAIGSVSDTNWHLCALTMAANGLTMQGFLDSGGLFQTRTNATDMRPQNFTTEYLGTSLTGANTPFGAFPGDMMLVAELPYVISTGQWSALYSVLADGGSGSGTATSATRWADILSWAGYNGLQSADNYTTGETVAYGPAIELQAARGSSGTAVATALQTVVDTESGSMFASANGTVALKARRARYNQSTPQVIFGEHDVASGEIPYTITGFGYDPTLIVDDAQFTQTVPGTVTTFTNAASIAAYGDFPLQRNINTLTAYEVSDAAQFWVGKNKQPQQRLIKITIKPSAYTLNGVPSLNAWLACLGLELGSFVQVNRRPPNAPQITLKGFVEQINWTNDDATNASVDLQISAYFFQQFWQMGSNSLTLKNAVGATGVTNCTINPLADAATNPIQANVSSAGDPYEWIIDAGLSTEELVTVTFPTPGTTGYTSAVLNIGTCQRTDTGATGTGFRFTHSVGAVLQDIGGYVEQAQYTHAALEALLAASSLNTYDLVGSTTIAGY